MHAIVKNSSHLCQAVSFAIQKHASLGLGYGVGMPKKRAHTKDTFRRNLEMLIRVTGMKNREIARRTRGKVSDRYIGMVLNGQCVPTVEKAEYIGQAFGLTGWHMIFPGLPLDLAKAGRLDKLIELYANSPAHVQSYVDGVVERDARLPPANDDDIDPDDDGDDGDGPPDSDSLAATDSDRHGETAIKKKGARRVKK